jgi:hypothetical protein
VLLALLAAYLQAGLFVAVPRFLRRPHDDGELPRLLAEAAAWPAVFFLRGRGRRPAAGGSP